MIHIETNEKRHIVTAPNWTVSFRIMPYGIGLEHVRDTRSGHKIRGMEMHDLAATAMAWLRTIAATLPGGSANV